MPHKKRKKSPKARLRKRFAQFGGSIFYRHEGETVADTNMPLASTFAKIAKRYFGRAAHFVLPEESKKPGCVNFTLAKCGKNLYALTGISLN